MNDWYHVFIENPDPGLNRAIYEHAEGLMYFSRLQDALNGMKKHAKDSHYEYVLCRYVF